MVHRCTLIAERDHVVADGRRLALHADESSRVVRWLGGSDQKTNQLLTERAGGDERASTCIAAVSAPGGRRDGGVRGDAARDRRMSQRCVESVLGRLITDAMFRDEFFVQPDTVCRDHALDLTPTELSALLQISVSGLESAAAGLDPRIVRAATGSSRTSPSSGAKSQTSPSPRRRRQGAP